MDLKEIAENIRTQDNRGTSDPIVVLFELKKIRTDKYHADDWIYIDTGDMDICEIGKTKEELIKYCQENDYDLPSDNKLLKSLNAERLFICLTDEQQHPFEMMYYIETQEYIDCFFTTKASEEYMETNKYKLKNPYTAINSLYRNPEMKLIRMVLMNDLFAEGNTQFPAWIVPGGKCDYHSIIGEEITKPGCTIQCPPYKMGDQSVVQLVEVSGCVSLEAITPIKD